MKLENPVEVHYRSMDLGFSQLWAALACFIIVMSIILAVVLLAVSDIGAKVDSLINLQAQCIAKKE